MKFSLVIPLYRKEDFLTRCLDSLAAQTDGDFEAIVVDDCSPGDAAQPESAPCLAERIVSRYGARFRYLRHEKNRGAFQARCTGVVAARGDYVVPVDPDDYLVPEALARLREAIDRENPDLVSYWIEWDDGGKIRPHWCRHANATVTGAEALRELTERTYFTGVASKAFRRETLVSALKALDAPDDLYVNTGDDFLMLVPMLLESERVTFLAFPGYRYFVNGGSTTFSWRSRRGFERSFAQLRAAGELIRRRAGASDVPPDMRRLVEREVAGLEDWFVASYRERSPLRRLKALVRRLLRRAAS